MKRLKKRMRWFGEIKGRYSRALTYLQIANSFMIFYLFIIQKPFGVSPYLWIVAGVCVVVSILFLDVGGLVQGEFAFLWRVNPEWMDFKDNTQKSFNNIDERLEKIEEAVKNVN